MKYKNSITPLSIIVHNDPYLSAEKKFDSDEIIKINEIICDPVLSEQPQHASWARKLGVIQNKNFSDSVAGIIGFDIPSTLTFDIMILIVSKL